MAQTRSEKNGGAHSDAMAARPKVSDLNALLELRVTTAGPEGAEEAAAYVERMDPGYSVRNRMLWWAQRPDATEIHSLLGWNERGRRARKASPRVYYLAPRRKSKDERVTENDDGIKGVCVRPAWNVTETCPIAPCPVCGAGEWEECTPDCTEAASLAAASATEAAGLALLAEVQAVIDDTKRRAAERAAGGNAQPGQGTTRQEDQEPGRKPGGRLVIEA